MVIKSELHARLINSEIELKYPDVDVDTTDPSTWKYYLNLAGKQHILNKDIYITSFDTQEEILFNSENFKVHKQTRTNYLVGTKNYYLLLKKYPEEELFIHGSLYPVDLAKAVAAKDLAILYYDQTLVEPQESSLINELQTFINDYDIRWNVRPFISSDELYPAAQHAIFTLNLLQKLVNIRLNNCMTHEAHSFHIKKYLASHYGLDIYVDYMSLSQAMFLYKNLRYIERNIGKVDTFKTLVKKLIEERNLFSLYELSVRQLHSINEDYMPKLLAKKQNITSEVNSAEKDFFEMEVFNEHQRPLAVDNEWVLDNYYPNIEHSLATNNSNSIKTKFLLSEAVDYKDALPYTLDECLLKHWMSWANNGNYHSYVTFNNALVETNNYLHVTDAFIYMLYLNKGYFRIMDDVIPAMINTRRIKDVKPKLEELLALIPNVEHRYLTTRAQEILDKWPKTEYVITSESFYRKCTEIHDYYLWQWYLISNTHDKDYEAYIKAMCDYMWVDECLPLDTTYTTFTDFVINKGLPEYKDKPIKVIRTINNIFNVCCNYEVDPYKQLRNIQEKLIEAMMLLSSYSINIIRSINPSKIKLAGWSDIRIGNIKHHIKDDEYSSLTLDVLKNSGTCKNYNLTDVALADTNPETAKYVSYTQIEIIDIEAELNNFRVKVYIENTLDIEKTHGSGAGINKVELNYYTSNNFGSSVNSTYQIDYGGIEATGEEVNLNAPAYTEISTDGVDEYNRYLNNMTNTQLLQIPVID